MDYPLGQIPTPLVTTNEAGTISQTLPTPLILNGVPQVTMIATPTITLYPTGDKTSRSSLPIFGVMIRPTPARLAILISQIGISPYPDIRVLRRKM